MVVPPQRIGNRAEANWGESRVGETESGVEGIADSLLGRSCEADAPDGVKRGHLEKRRRRDVQCGLSLCPGEQLARAPSDAPYVPMHAPESHVCVEQHHARAPLISYSPSIGSNGRSYVSTLPLQRAEKPPLPRLTVGNQLRDGFAVFRHHLFRARVAHAAHQLEAPGLELGRRDPFSGAPVGASVSAMTRSL
jgi:hypothetical protein